MVTRELKELYVIPANTTKDINVANLKKACLKVDCNSASGAFYLDLFTSPTVTKSTTNRADATLLGNLILNGSLRLGSKGVAYINVDLSDVKNINIVQSGASWGGNIVMYDGYMSEQDIIINKQTLLYYECLDRIINFNYIAKSLQTGINRLDIQLSNDMTTWTGAYDWFYIHNKKAKGLWGADCIDGENTCYAYGMSYKYMRVQYSIVDGCSIKIKLCDRNYTGGVLLNETGAENKYVELAKSGLLHKYKNAKVEFGESTISKCMMRIRSLNTILYPLDLSNVMINHDILDVNGSISSGGVIIRSKGDGLSNLIINRQGGATNGSININATITLSNNIEELRKSDIIAYENNAYKAITVNRDLTKKADVFGNDVLEFDNTTLTYYNLGYGGIKHEIVLNSDSFPNIKSGEQIKFAYLLPYSDSVNSYKYPNRIVVFTNKGRVLHNYPSGTTSADFNPLYGGLSRFDESVVYDDTIKYVPTNILSNADSLRKYMPYIVGYDYDQLAGRGAAHGSYIDTYLNGGLPADAAGKLIYRKQLENCFGKLASSSMARSEQGAVFGNYNLSDGQDCFIMVSKNGGKTWNITHKWMLPDAYYEGCKGLPVNLLTLGSYTASSLKVNRKYYNAPTSDVKEPATPFIIKTESEASVTSMEYVNGTTRLTLSKSVDTIYDIWFYKPIFFTNVNATGDWQYCCNNGFTADGKTNNGVFFRAKLVEGTTNKIDIWADCGDAYQSELYGRHIHSVNTFENGWVVSCGESVVSTSQRQGGDIYVLYNTAKDGNNTIDISKLKMCRLTSGEKAVNRACGAYIMSDKLIYCSDQPVDYTASSKKVNIAGRTNLPTYNTVGIQMCNISDVDDVNKSHTVCAIGKCMLGLLVHKNSWVAQAFDGENAVSTNGYDWHILPEELNNEILGIDNNGSVYLSDKKILLK